MFIIQASLQRIYEIPFSIHRLCDFFSDPQSFARNMPIIDHIAPMEGGYDLSRWRFVVRAPIVAPIVWEFLVRRRINEETGEIFYASPDGDRDMFRCDVHVRSGANGATDADVRLTVRLVRDHAKEIHPLAGWVGERWINRIVLDRMDKMATIFVQNGLHEIQRLDAEAAGVEPPPSRSPAEASDLSSSAPAPALECKPSASAVAEEVESEEAAQPVGD
jgi:hypothetical protein